MAITKAQSRALIQEIRAEVAALDLQITDAQAAVNQARATLSRLEKQRQPLPGEIDVLVQRHKRLFGEDEPGQAKPT